MRLFLVLCVSMFFLAGCDVIQPMPPSKGCCPQPKQTSRVEVLAFTAKWCQPCCRNHPQLEEIRRSGVKVTEIDVDENPRLAQQYHIHELPTYVILQNGVETHRTGDIALLVTILIRILRIAIPWILSLILS